MKTAAGTITLFLMNALVCERLFFSEYLSQLGSADGAFIAMSRYLVDHGDSAWWPIWFCGMPGQTVYGPLLPRLTAAAAGAWHISPALAFHHVAALFYCMAPAALFWMVRRLSGSPAWAWWASLLYSLLSPAAILVPAVRADIGGMFYLRRLYNTVVYGETPHVVALALIPLAVAALDAAIRTRKLGYLALTAALMAGTVLTNVAGAIGLAMAVMAYLVSLARGGRRAAFRRTGLIALLAYGLAAPWIPPSTIRLIAANSQVSVGNYYPFTAMHVLYFGLIAGGAALLCIALEKLHAAAFLRFALLLSFFAAAVSLPSFWNNISILPQPQRFQLELEMGLCLAGGFLLMKLFERLPERGPLAVVSLLSLAALAHNRERAAELIRPIDIRGTIEYKAAAWFDRNMHGRRVFAPGSVSLWMNVFSDTPQLGGCCDQGVPHWQQRVALFILYTGLNAGGQEGEIGRLWLQAYGVHAAGVSGPGSQEWFKVFANPKKFEGVLPVLWREGGDAIYQVPQRSDSLAHVMRADRIVSTPPKNGVDVAPLRPYVAALNDPQLPLARMEWSGPSRARITAVLKTGDVLSAQVSYHPGWHARVNGSTRPIRGDALGMMVIEPRCSGACTVDLTYDGGMELHVARAVQLASIASAVILLLAAAAPLRGRRNPRSVSC